MKTFRVSEQVARRFLSENLVDLLQACDTTQITISSVDLRIGEFDIIVSDDMAYGVATSLCIFPISDPMKYVFNIPGDLWINMESYPLDMVTSELIIEELNTEWEVLFNGNLFYFPKSLNIERMRSDLNKIKNSFIELNKDILKVVIPMEVEDSST